VSEEVEKQIREFLPVSLEEQVQDAREHLERLKRALKNSYGFKLVSWTRPDGCYFVGKQG
jgi:hypothetical protein